MSKYKIKDRCNFLILYLLIVIFFKNNILLLFKYKNITNI